MNEEVLKLLAQMVQHMHDIKRDLQGVVNYIHEAESECPEKLRRFANYYHDCHDIKYMYEEHGIPVPEHILSEIRRLDDRYRQILDKYNVGGGAIEKVRREMAGDKANRWDHTLRLEPPKETGNGEIPKAR